MLGFNRQALIDILKGINRVFALDFSKAFHTIKHSCVLAKLGNMDIDDSIYNWFVNYFKGDSHCTKFNGSNSNYVKINAGVFQGSAVGPAMFTVGSHDLQPLHSENYIDKYADDSIFDHRFKYDLIIGSNKDHTIGRAVLWPRHSRHVPRAYEDYGAYEK